MKEDTTPIDPTWMGKTGGFARDMTLRDHYAGLASEADIKNFLCSEGKETVEKDSFGAEYTYLRVIYYTREQAKYQYADAMLSAREGK